MREAIFLCVYVIFWLACGGDSESDGGQQAVSCILDSTSEKSCWSFVGKSSEDVEVIRTKCEDGTGFGSEGTFEASACPVTQSIGSCSVVLEDFGAGTLYFYPQWDEAESANLCSDILSGTYSDSGDMSLVEH